MADLQKLVVRLEAETAKYQRELQKSQKQLAAFQKTSVAAVDGIKKSFATLGGIAALTAFSKHTLDVGDALAKMSQKTGVAVPTLSRLGYAADLSGVSMEALGMAMQRNARFSADLERGLKEPRAALDALGISTQEYLDLDAEGRLLIVADAFSRYEDGAGKAAAAQLLFGRTGAELIPFLNEGRDGIKALADESDALGNTWDTETAKAFEAFNDDISRLQTTGAALARPVLADLVMYMDAFAIAVLDLKRPTNEAASEVGDLADKFKELFDIIEAHPRAFSMGLLGGVTFGPAVGGLSAAAGFMLDELETWKNAQEQAASGDYGPPVPPWLQDGGIDFSKFDGSGTASAGRPQVRFGDTSGADKAAKQIDNLIKGLEKEAATLGMTTEQTKFYDLATAGASEAQLAHAQALIRTISAYDMQQEAMQDAVDEQQRMDDLAKSYLPVLDQLDGGVQRYRDSLAELQKLVENGNLSQQQATAIAGELSKQMDTLANDMREAGLAFGDDIERSFGGALKNMITDAANWKDHLLDFVASIGDAFAELAANLATQALFGSATGGGGNALGGIVGALLSEIGGAADGGVIPRGGWSWVGEEGPELVYSPNVSRVFSNPDSMDMVAGKRGGGDVIFNIQTPDANSFVASRRQIQRRERARLGVFQA